MWELGRFQCRGVKQRKFNRLEWDDGTVEWLSRTEGPHSYNLTEAGLSKVSQHVQSAVGVPIDRALRKSGRGQGPSHQSPLYNVKVQSDGTGRPVVTVDVVVPPPPKGPPPAQNSKHTNSKPKADL